MNKSVSNFRIMQFADLHYGETEARNNLTKALMILAITKEQPDFIVFSGDQLSGYMFGDMTSACVAWEEVLNVAASFGIPFATVFGNHDDQPYHYDPIIWWKCTMLVILVAFVSISILSGLSKRYKLGFWCLRYAFLIYLTFSISAFCYMVPTGARRRMLIEHEKKLYPLLSRTGLGQPSIDGVSNYRVVEQGVSMLFVDSGGGSLPEAIFASQLNWVVQQPKTSIAFVHIPPDQYQSIYDPQSCSGKIPLELSTTCLGSESLVLAFAAVGVQAVFVGHDHGNAWCCPFYPAKGTIMNLCYGQHSGFGGYSLSHRRGIRIIVMNNETGDFNHTYVVNDLDVGTIMSILNTQTNTSFKFNATQRLQDTPTRRPEDNPIHRYRHG